jgi:hypothetical protein
LFRVATEAGHEQSYCLLDHYLVADRCTGAGGLHLENAEPGVLNISVNQSAFIH